MYESLARYRFEVTGVKAEQVQDISSDDCIDEGIRYGGTEEEIFGKTHDQLCSKMIDEFHALWDSIYGGTEYSWQKNCWVWCITFKKV